MPQVSVIIPNLNNARYIEASIMSVLNQTLKDIEIIVIDDGSTDESWEIIQKLSQEDPRIITIKNPQNIGTGPSRNKGLDIATGEYIKFLDADDTMDSDVLESMYTAAQEHNAQIVCGYMRFCDSISWDEPLRPSEIIGEEKLICPDDQGSEFVFEQMGVGDGLYAASLFNGVRFPNLKWEDLATIPILKYKAGQIFYMDKAVYNYYMNNNSTTLTDHTKKTPRIRDVFDCITILRNGIPQEYSDRIDYLEFLHIFERISEIMNWDDCSRENKEKLISALHQFFQIDVPNYIENPFISCESLSYIRKLSQQHSVTQSLDVNPLIDYIGKSIDIALSPYDLDNYTVENFQYIRINGVSKSFVENATLLSQYYNSDVKYDNKNGGYIDFSGIPRESMESFLADSLIRFYSINHVFKVLPQEQQDSILNCMYQVGISLVPDLDNYFILDNYSNIKSFILPQFQYYSKEECIAVVADVVQSPEFQQYSMGRMAEHCISRVTAHTCENVNVFFSNNQKGFGGRYEYE